MSPTPRAIYGKNHQDEIDKLAAQMRAKAKFRWTDGTPRFVTDLLRRAAMQHCTRPVDILSGIRQRNVCKARWQVIRALAADPREFSSVTIGRWLGLHHTTVLNCLKLGSARPYASSDKIAELAPYDPDLPDFSGEWI